MIFNTLPITLRSDRNRAVSFSGLTIGLLFALGVLVLLPINVWAQGSIFGQVTNSDLSIPSDSSISFFGYLNSTDDEVRINLVDGAGFNNGNWFDDFQNYLSEAPGIPYIYRFYDTLAGERFSLSKLVPNNSFQQEDIQLALASWPAPAVGVIATGLMGQRIRLTWNAVVGITYHIYRRQAVSNGSFFRIDDPSGNMSNPGVADSIFIDSTVAPAAAYDYIIIAESGPEFLSPYSDIVTASAVTACCVIRGDVDQSGDTDISDLTFMVNYIFGGGPPPGCLEEADMDASNTVDISDLTYLINYIFGGGPPPIPC